MLVISAKILYNKGYPVKVSVIFIFDLGFTRTANDSSTYRKSAYEKEVSDPGYSGNDHWPYTLVVQLLALNRKYQSYKAREAQLTEELQAQKEKKQDLKDYEKYTKTKEYTESRARSKLGLLYDNEIIFKEK